MNVSMLLDHINVHAHLVMNYSPVESVKVKNISNRNFQVFVNYEKKTFLDIDECETGNHACPSNEECHNTGGSYKCVNLGCPSGYKQISTRTADRLDNLYRLCVPIV